MPCDSRVILPAVRLRHAIKWGPLTKPIVSKAPPRNRWRAPALRLTPKTIRPVAHHRARQRALRLRARQSRRLRKQLVTALMHMATGSVLNSLDVDAQISGTAAGTPIGPQVDGATEAPEKMRRPRASGRACKTRRGSGDTAPILFRPRVPISGLKTRRWARTSGIAL